MALLTYLKRACNTTDVKIAMGLDGPRLCEELMRIAEDQKDILVLHKWPTKMTVRHAWCTAASKEGVKPGQTAAQATLLTRDWPAAIGAEPAPVGRRYVISVSPSR